MNPDTQSKLNALKDKALAFLAKPTTVNVAVIVGVVGFVLGAVLF